MTMGDAVCWAHMLCDECGALASGPDDHRRGCSEQHVRALDVTTLVPREKHLTIFRLLDALSVGATLCIVNDHDPLPLRTLLERKASGAFAWTYLESGPERWRARITKTLDLPSPLGGFERLPVVLPPREGL